MEAGGVGVGVGGAGVAVGAAVVACVWAGCWVAWATTVGVPVAVGVGVGEFVLEALGEGVTVPEAEADGEAVREGLLEAEGVAVTPGVAGRPSSSPSSLMSNVSPNASSPRPMTPRAAQPIACRVGVLKTREKSPTAPFSPIFRIWQSDGPGAS